MAYSWEIQSRCSIFGIINITWAAGKQLWVMKYQGSQCVLVSLSMIRLFCSWLIATRKEIYFIFLVELNQVKEETDLFIIDEVGKMELFSSAFFPAVMRVMESNIPLLATIPIPRHGRDIPGGTMLSYSATLQRLLINNFTVSFKIMYKIPFPWLLVNIQSIHMYLRTCFCYTFKACVQLARLAASNKLNNISCTETRLI